ncbi:hypothetical protein AB0E75_05200 [Streptomyces griseoviridis]|jgi:hypothetical protein|uniref:Uncharacterized protein n=3 Tax=Streptomyces TaxID=1883 RepID=A0A918GUR9_STRGD|nr:MULTISPECIES: hypothetical protein [Streptomyces]MDP9685954.1 hypothetical protein [Streptomyces griseoviridis]GGS64875.1 hypothetical protein GCM10010238_62380 [Streptomyces niveoruber]GGS78360.1 hypothetical protein GCM10010240_09420 [Streptomyces griseoviridis]GGU15777.1 hypothetical protein GCM10010259_02600 [Streptomyces daghestanicus]GHI35241.1 hypothetical protein Sdagh_69710 [Streptomyces daghestanicus]
MTRSSRLLCALYLATSTGLAWTAVSEWRYGPPWAAAVFAGASVVPLIAVVREADLAEPRRAPVRPPRAPDAASGAADALVRAELDGACCERWWTSLGTDHDAGCGRRVPRSSAA